MQVSAAINTMVSYGTSAIQNQDRSYKDAGDGNGSNYVDGVKSSSNLSNTKSAGLLLAKNVLDGLQKFYTKDYSTGNTSGEKYTTGVSNKQSDANKAGKALAAAALDGVKYNILDFKTVGSNASQGYVDGLRSKISEAQKAAKELADTTSKTTAKSLDERSPSHIMNAIGDFAGLGYINGLMYYVSVAAKTGEEIGNNTVNGIQNTLSDGITQINNLDDLATPIITPIMDTSNITDSMSAINDMFNEAICKTYDVVSTIDYSYKDSKDAMIDNISQTLRNSNSENVSLMKDLIDAVNSGETDVNVQVKLQGDAAGVFKLVKNENDKRIKATKYNTLAKTSVTVTR
jgi:hypothetical protein